MGHLDLHLVDGLLVEVEVVVGHQALAAVVVLVAPMLVVVLVVLLQQMMAPMEQGTPEVAVAEEVKIVETLVKVEVDSV